MKELKVISFIIIQIMIYKVKITISGVGGIGYNYISAFQIQSKILISLYNIIKIIIILESIFS